MSRDWLRQEKNDVLLEVLVQPRASKSEVIGEHDGRLKVRLKAPPVDGAANKELIAFFSKRFGVPKQAVQLEAGSSSRRKRIRIVGIKPETAASILEVA